MSEFEFGGIDTSTPKKLVAKISNDNLIYEDLHGSRGNVLFVMAYWPSAQMLRAFRIWIEKHLPNYAYRIILGSTIKASEEEITKTGVARFFRLNAVDLRKYSFDKQVVVAVGRGLYATTRSSDVMTMCFYDYVFNKTYFYSSLAQSYVFPIDGLGELIHGEITSDRKQLSSRSGFEKEFKTDVFQGSRKGAIPSTPKDCFRRYFAELQFKTIGEKYRELCGGITEPRLKLHKIQTKEDLQTMYEKYKTAKYVAWDLETSGFDHVHDRVGCITMAFSKTEGYYIPWSLIDIEELNLFFKDKIGIGQNLKFDIKFAKRELLKARGYPEFVDDCYISVREDTLPLAQRLCEFRFNGLKSLAYYYSPFGGYDAALDDYKDRYHPESYLDIPEPILSEYATKDAIVTFWVWEEMQDQLTQLDLQYPPQDQSHCTMRQYYEDTVMPAHRVFPDIEMIGIVVDVDIWDKNSDIVEERIKELQTQLHKELRIDEYVASTSKTAFQSDDIDWFDSDESDEEDQKSLTSSKRLGELLEWLGWPDMGRSKLGQYMTGDGPLALWKKAGYTAAGTLQKLRSYRALQRTFVGRRGTKMGWRQHLKYHPEDKTWRFHPTYMVMAAESGRNICKEPNWQQIPAHGETADLVKEFISNIFPEKAYLATLDYSSLQIRLAAIDSEDRVLTRAYIEDSKADLHSITGFNVFAKNKQFEIEEVVITDNGVERVLLAGEKVRVRDSHGNVVERIARDLQEKDSLI